MEELETATEDELYFRRFPPEKQDSIRALVSYVTLLDLNGKDLISIGGRLERIKASRQAVNNQNIILGMDIRPVGKDKDLRRRWVYLHEDGTRYYFDSPGWSDVRVRSGLTNVTKHVTVPEQYDVKKVRSLNHNRYLANIMLNVYHGKIKLNF